jgi:two-component system sensor histidine kinase TtrS
MREIFAVAFALLLFFSQNCFSAENSAPLLPVVRVALINCEEHLHYREINASFLKILQKTFQGVALLNIGTMSVPEMEAAVKNRSVDIFLSSSGFYRTMMHDGVRDIATVTSDLSSDPNHADASFWFTRKDREDIRTLEDLKGKVVSAKHPSGFTGWITGVAEIAKLGHDPENFFKKINFKGWNVQAVIRDVASGRSDAAVMQSCNYEEFQRTEPELVKDLKGINLQESAVFPCLHSTALYPNWTVVITPSLSLDFAKKLAAGLLSEPPGENGLQWSVATDFDEVDKILKLLKLEPYAYLRDHSLKAIVRKYSYLFSFFGALFLAALLYSLYANKVIRKRTQKLHEAMAQSQKYQKEFNNAKERLTFLTRMGLTNQISTVIAHELRNDLSSIKLYAFGLLRQMEKDGVQDKTAGILREIHAKANMANETITKIRSFAQKGFHFKKCDLREVAEKTIANFILSESCSEDISLIAEDSVFISADEFEIELLLINLLRNASVALKSKPHGKVAVSVKESGSQVILQISDNGKKFTVKEIEALSNFLTKTQSDGHGYGLSLVREIVGDHNGEVQFSANVPEGLCVSIILPAYEEKKSC